MFISYFTEQPYSAFRDETSLASFDGDHPLRRPSDNNLIFSNRFFDPAIGSRLYNERIEEHQFAEEVGFDGITFNEHHNAVYCMQPRCNVMAAVLAARTSRVKIVQLGNPLPTWENPVQLAEETAMLDMISKGRMVPGIVRGGGVEQLANNVNPAFNRERFREAHDLIIKTWTEPGPFRWEGDHYNLRIVNPWALPLQQPHPPIWMPGIASNETIAFAAEHGYPYICMNTTFEATKRIWRYYDGVAAENGFTAGPSYRGYLMRCVVAGTERKAIDNARQFMWMRGQFTGLGHPVWSAPAGYSSRATKAIRAEYQAHSTSFEDQLDAGTIIAGTPGQVIGKIRRWLEETRPGILILWGSDGRTTHEDTLDCIRLLGQEVLPAVRDIARELQLHDPFELNQPVSLAAARRSAAAA
jgi:alkanesulfonate monooxygenase SsuD/methylene tetrahydromethanopterin reductase-like flavin-dependent oxidoreductase (luciferase family)